jgi:hypothetical protein
VEWHHSNKKQPDSGTKTEDQWNRIKDADKNPHSYSHLIFDKGAQNIRWRKDSPFNKFCWENWIAECKRLKLDLHLSPCTNTNSKWTKNPNIRTETFLKLVQEIGNTQEHYRHRQ